MLIANKEYYFHSNECLLILMNMRSRANIFNENGITILIMFKNVISIETKAINVNEY